MKASRENSLIRQSPKLPAGVRREQLLAAAERLFLKQGYHATTVDEIARAAKLTKGAVYYHYKSKEDILVDMVRIVADSFLDGLRRLPERSLSPVDFFKALQRSGKQPGLPRIHRDLDFRVQAVRIPRVQSFIRKAFDVGIEIFSERVDPKYARTAADRRTLAIFIYCLWDGLSMRMASDPGLVDLKRQTGLFQSLIERATLERRRK